MKTNQNENVISVKLKNNSYSIIINQDLLSNFHEYIKKLNIGKKILIVTQDRIPLVYLKKIKKSFTKADLKIFVLTLKTGEQHKDLNSFLTILNFAIKNKFERNDTFCALGGGVVSDLTGFAASVYYRGCNFICIPTTLLGMVDAAIGGKTAINIKAGKNLIGSFYQPKIIFIDPSCLKTLSKKEFLIGMGEVIKYALLEKTSKTKFSNVGFFNFLRTNREKILKLEKKSLLKIINYSCTVKSNIVSKDEKESSLRAVLNLGHTFAHGIEQAYNYKNYTHGEAVAIGICLASLLSNTLGILDEKVKNSIINLISSYGLPTKLNDSKKIPKILKSMLLDKKIKDGRLRFILPDKEIGKVKIVSGISLKKIKALFN